ncbi:MAG: hypothetical protein ACP5R6_02935 [Chlorobaculum sp.]
MLRIGRRRLVRQRETADKTDWLAADATWKILSTIHRKNTIPTDKTRAYKWLKKPVRTVDCEPNTTRIPARLQAVSGAGISISALDGERTLHRCHPPKKPDWANSTTS